MIPMDRRSRATRTGDTGVPPPFSRRVRSFEFRDIENRALLIRKAEMGIPETASAIRAMSALIARSNGLRRGQVTRSAKVNPPGTLVLMATRTVLVPVQARARVRA